MAKKKKSKKKYKRPERIVKFAKGMRGGRSTFHEQVTRDILKKITDARFIQRRLVSNQRCFYDKAHDKWYIVDFYIVPLRLVIEIDGPNHEKHSQIVYDKKRTRFLESLGNKVVRFKNSEVETLTFREKLEVTIDARINEVEWKAPSCSIRSHKRKIKRKKAKIAKKERKREKCQTTKHQNKRNWASPCIIRRPESVPERDASSCV